MGTAMVRTLLPRRPAVRRITGVLVTGVVVLSGTGCSADGNVPAAAPTTSAAVSPEASSTAPTPIDPGPFLDRLVEVQMEARTVHVVLNGLITGRAELDFGADGVGAKTDVSIAVGGQQLQLRTVDGTTYFTSAELGEQWLSADSDDPASGPWAEAAAPVDADPLAQVARLRRAVTSAAFAGRVVTIDGSIEDHYTLTVDVTRMEGMESVAELGIAEVTYHYVEDDAGLPRSVYYELADQYVSLTMSGWGTPVNVVAPDPSLVQAVGGSGA